MALGLVAKDSLIRGSLGGRPHVTSSAVEAGLELLTLTANASINIIKAWLGSFHGE